MRGAGATGGSRSRSASAAQHLPAIEAIDLKREGPPRGRFIAPRLAGAVKTALERGEQALFFLNRRGYAPLTLCRACGFRLNCPNCDAWLVDHRFRRQLVCHHCGFATPPPAACPKCQAADSFVACGPGVERLEEEVAALFPEQRVLVLSSDLVVSIERMREEFREIEEGRVDIVIGTQLVAKGHHFPRLNLVGVVDADLGLGSGDPRAGERTFQLLHQVIGRAGREEGHGVGYLQTHQPEHPVMKALIAQDREAFYNSEIALREQVGLSAVRAAREPARHRRRQARDGRLCPPRRRGRAAQRGREGARAGRSAARADPRPPPLPPDGEVGAQFRSAGLLARMARACAEAQGRPEARRRRRSAEFLVNPSPASGGMAPPEGQLRVGSTTQAEAAKISTKPMMSGTVGRSPRIIAVEITPITGALRIPSEAVIAGRLPTIRNQRK